MRCANLMYRHKADGCLNFDVNDFLMDYDLFLKFHLHSSNTLSNHSFHVIIQIKVQASKA